MNPCTALMFWRLSAFIGGQSLFLGLNLTGTKYGCGVALCGACTVHADGNAIRSCVTPVSAVGEKKITTIEAIGGTRPGRAVQASWEKLDVVQCGYCQSGQIMSAAALLAKNGNPAMWTSTRRCRATSAAVQRMCAYAQRSKMPRRASDKARA